MFPDFTTYLTTDFSLESAHAPQPEMCRIGSCRVASLQFDNHVAILLRDMQRTGIGKIPIEFLRDVEPLSVDENKKSFSHEPRHTAIHSPCATIGFTALTAFTLALPENHPYLFTGGKSMVFFVLKGRRFFLRENRVGCEKG
jgi:hypothetical protein